MVAYTNGAVVGNNWPELQIRTLGVVVLVVTEVRLWPGEGYNNSVARDYLFFRIDRANRRIRGGTLILLAEKHEAQEGHKQRAPKIEALEVITATGSLGISVIGV